MIHPIESMIRCIQRTEELNARATDIYELELQSHNNRIVQLKEESIQKVREEEESTKKRDTWSLFSTASEYVANGSAIALGTVAAGPVGTVMAASGALGLANRISYDTGLTKWAASWFYDTEETQNTIASTIETATSYLSMGLNAASSLWAIHTHALQAILLADNVKKALGIGTAAVTTSTQLGMTFYDRKISNLHLPIKELQIEQQDLEQRKQQQTLDMVNMIESAQVLTDVARKAIVATEIQGE